MNGYLSKAKNTVTRRDFLRGTVVTTAAALGFPYVVPSSVFGATAPSNRIVMGCIGVGGMGTNNMRAFLGHSDVQVAAVCDVVTSSHERSRRKTRFGCELVRNGRIGELKRIVTLVGPNNRIGPPSDWKPMPIPDGFDYDMWLGPAPWEPYHKDRCLYKFRFILDYSGGQTTNLGAHSLDMAQWSNGMDDTGPVEVENLGGEFPKGGLFNTPTKIHFLARYANGVELICRTDVSGWVGARFEGTEGWIEIGKRFRTHPESLKESVIGPDEIHLYRSENHHRNFIDCIKTGRKPAAPVEVGHRSATVCHLGNIAMMLKRKLQWDPENERFVNDEEANRMLDRPRRAPLHI